MQLEKKEVIKGIKKPIPLFTTIYYWVLLDRKKRGNPYFRKRILESSTQAEYDQIIQII